jgi:hypothetical protein
VALAVVVNEDVVHGLWTLDLGPWTWEFGICTLMFEFLKL